MATPQNNATALALERSVKTELYLIDTSFTTLAVVAVIFRLWARSRSAGYYGWDDWLVVLCLVVILVNFALNVVMIENGLGWQVASVHPDAASTVQKMIYGDEVVYVTGLAMIKVAILVMYFRVFPLRSFKIGAWILGVVTVLWSLISVFLFLFQCAPISKAWLQTTSGRCFNLQTLVIGNAIPNILTDIAILAMPTYYASRLQMKKAQKIGLTGIFLLGAFVIVASICRLTLFLQSDQKDRSETLKNLTTWSHVEMSVALISACLPTMRPLLTALLGLAGLSWPSHSEEDHTISAQTGSTLHESVGRPDRSVWDSSTTLEDGLERASSDGRITMRADNVRKNNQAKDILDVRVISPSDHHLDSNEMKS